MLSEKVELLGKNIYTDIPSSLTIKALPTVTELDYVSAEDFEATMLEKILPQVVEEKIDFNNLLEIDFQWLCRCIRFLTYGPYFTTNVLLCNNCGEVRTEAQVDLRVVECIPLPDTFTNDIVIEKGQLIDFDKDIHLHLLSIKEAMSMRKDALFTVKGKEQMGDLARICYMITSIGNTKVPDALAAKLEITKNLSNADLKALKAIARQVTDYGLRGGGRCKCPRCGGDAMFFALADDRFFRPTVGDLRSGKDDRSLRGVKVSGRDSKETV